MLATSHSIVVLHLQLVLHLQVYKNIPMWKSVSSASEGGSGADNRMEKLEKYENIKLNMCMQNFII